VGTDFGFSSDKSQRNVCICQNTGISKRVQTRAKSLENIRKAAIYCMRLDGYQFEAARERLYCQIRMDAKDHDSVCAFALEEVVKVRKRRSIRDIQTMGRIKDAARHIGERIDAGAGDEEIEKLIELQCRLMDHLDFRPMCEAWGGLVDIPRKKS